MRDALQLPPVGIAPQTVSQRVPMRDAHPNAGAPALGYIAVHQRLLQWRAMGAPHSNKFSRGRCIAHQLRGSAIGRRYRNSRDIVQEFCIFADERLL